MRTKTLTAALLAAGSLGVAVPASASAYANIQTPTGNIVCSLRASTTTLLCDVKSDDLGVRFNAYGRPHGTGLNGVYGGRTIAYGTTITSTHFRCTSRFSGLRCTSRENGHGVFLARDGKSYRF